MTRLMTHPTPLPTLNPLKFDRKYMLCILGCIKHLTLGQYRYFGPRPSLSETLISDFTCNFLHPEHWLSQRFFFSRSFTYLHWTFAWKTKTGSTHRGRHRFHGDRLDSWVFPHMMQTSHIVCSDGVVKVSRSTLWTVDILLTRPFNFHLSVHLWLQPGLLKTASAAGAGKPRQGHIH